MYATVTEGFTAPKELNLTFQLSNSTRVPAPTDYERALFTQADNKWADFGSYGTLLDEDRQRLIQVQDDIQANPLMYKNISNYDCIRGYDSAFNWRPHVLLISHDFDVAAMYNTSLFVWGINTPSATNVAGFNPISWTNDSVNDWQAISTLSASKIAAWADMGHRVQYCLSRQDVAGEKEFRDCRVQCAPALLLGIVSDNRPVQQTANSIRSCGIFQSRQVSEYAVADLQETRTDTVYSGRRDCLISRESRPIHRALWSGNESNH